MECPKCHAENRDDSRFCSNCAAPLGPGVGDGPEGASLTKTLETPVRVLKPGALVASKYRIAEELGRPLLLGFFLIEDSLSGDPLPDGIDAVLVDIDVCHIQRFFTGR